MPVPDDPRARGHALRPQQRRDADDAGQVALDLPAAHEGPTPAAGHPAYRPGLLQRGERLTHRRPAHAELGGEVALGAEPGAGAQPAVADLVLQPGQDPFAPQDRSRSTDQATQPSIAAMASGDSGSTWPPSTTICWPVT